MSHDWIVATLSSAIVHEDHKMQLKASMAWIPGTWDKFIISQNKYFYNVIVAIINLGWNELTVRPFSFYLSVSV